MGLDDGGGGLGACDWNHELARPWQHKMQQLTHGTDPPTLPSPLEDCEDLADCGHSYVSWFS